jgi:hypothetical protein
MTDGELGCLVVDIAADDAIQVTPTNDETQNNTALVHALAVICDP